MAPTRPLRSLALLLGLCASCGFAPGALAEPLDDPIDLGSFDTPGEAYGVAVVGTRAYVADGVFGLRVIDVANPSLPVEIGSFDTPNYA
jgi:hypothetical protein